jgi:Copper transport outer membrane protein, MctB
MVDLRYHVASLAAVFIALVIGILVGVGLSSRGSVSNPEKARLHAIINEKEDRIRLLSGQVSSLRQQQDADGAYIDATAPLLMAGRLAGERVGVVFIGPINGPLPGKITDALMEANASPASPIRSLKAPIDPQAIDNLLAGKPAYARFVGDSKLGDLGRVLGRQLATTGETPLWNLLYDQLVNERRGRLRQLDGLVVVRSANAQLGPTARFLAGFYKGLANAGIPVVGAEAKDAQVSAVPAFDQAHLASVDDVDTASGELALVVLLAGGGESGAHYGVKPGAQAILPPLG